MADQFETWGKLLELRQANKTKAAMRAAFAKTGIMVYEKDPHSGYYRYPAEKGGPLLPVAIWRQDGSLCVLHDGRPTDLGRVWQGCVFSPIPYEWYEDYTERTGKWPDAAIELPDDEPERPAAEAAAGSAAATPSAEPAAASAAPTQGAPEKSADPEIDRIKRQIEAAVTAAALYAKISSDDEAAAAQSARAKLNTLSNEADKRRKALMLPFEIEAKKIHEVYMPLVKKAKVAADGIRDGGLKAWVNRPQPKPEAHAAEPEVGIPTARTAGDRVTPQHNQPPEMMTGTAPPPPTTAFIKGAEGRGGRVTSSRIAKVADYDAAYQHMKALPDVKLAIDRAAQRLVSAGQTVPGVEVTEERAVA